MTWKCEDVAERSLKAAATSENFELHLAALEWSLIDPIIINSEADIKATNWRELGLKPFTHQIQNLITFCRRLPVALIADDVGLGKTISAGLILSELITRKRVKRAIVVCPKVLTEQWVGELDKKFGIVAKEASGAGLDLELQRGTPVVVTTYHSISPRLAALLPGQFDFCILDEAHKLRNLHGSQNPPQMATNVFDALKRRLFKYVVMLTATPVQNKVWDLYSLIDLLKAGEGKPNPLGTPAEFSNRFVLPGSSGRQLQPQRSSLFQNLVRPNFTRTRRADVRLKFPKRDLHTIRTPFTGPEAEMQQAVGLHISGFNALSQTSLLQAMMSSPAALLKQAENMSGSKSFGPEVVQKLRELAGRVPIPAKLARLLALLEDLRGQRGETWRAVVFTVRRETQEMIGAELKRRDIGYGFIRGADPAGNRRTIAGYDAETPSVHVIVSTDAGAEGINLQKGNWLINYDLPWNPMVVEQRIGRVQRLGSDFENVVILNLVGAGTVEDRIVSRLLDKLQGVQQALGDIEGILSAAGLDEDGNKSFESRIREMVVAALQNKDVAAAERLLVADIDRAKSVFEAEKETLDRVLGNHPDDPASHRPPPKIERNPPRMHFREFVLGAKRADGWAIREIDEHRLEATAPGRVLERIRFNDDLDFDSNKAYFADSAARCYLPGKPAFERLVQHWVDHHAHKIVRTDDGIESKTIAIAQQWCRTLPGGEFVSAKFQPLRSAYQGELHIKVTAGTGVDKFEKLVRTSFQAPEGKRALEIAETAVAVTGDVGIRKVNPGYNAAVKAAVEVDPEVGLFCNYYAERLREGLGGRDLLTGAHDAALVAKMEADFRPFVQADIVAIDGVQYEIGTIEVQYKIDGATYTSRFEAVPAARQQTSEVARDRCAITDKDWPIDCLAACDSTGKLALRHKLILTASAKRVLPSQAAVCSVTGERHWLGDTFVSAVSGKVAHISKLIRCQETGDTILWAETGISDLSERLIREDLLAVSAKPPHRRAAPSEFRLCSASQRRLLQDEVGTTASGRTVDKDLLHKSSKSGRLGLSSEMVTCESTQSRILLVESAKCSESGKRVDIDLLHKCSVTGSLAQRQYLSPCDLTGSLVLEASLLTCEKTGQRVLPTRIATCQETGKQVCDTELGICAESSKSILKELLAISDCSGKSVNRALLVECEVTGKKGLPGELGVCELTGKRVVRSELGKCEISGQSILKEFLARSDCSITLVNRNLLVKCDVTGKKGLPGELAVCEFTGKRVVESLLVTSDFSGRKALHCYAANVYLPTGVALTDEVSTCAWSGEQIIRTSSAICTLTGLRVSNRYTNRHVQLKALSDVLDGLHGLGIFRLDPASALRKLIVENDRDLARSETISCIRSPNGLYAVCCEATTRVWLRRKTILYGFVLRVTPEGCEFVGTGIDGFRDQRHEFVIETEGLVFGK